MRSFLLHSHRGGWKLAAPLACIGFALALSGCGDGEGELTSTDPQAQVSGSVTFEGKPVTVDSDVVFFCKDKAVTASGKVDSLGKYSLKGSIAAYGLPAGRYEVMIVPPSPPPPVVGTPEYEQQMRGKAPKPVLPKDIPVKFHSYATSKLVIEVKPGENTFDFDLSKL